MGKLKGIKKEYPITVYDFDVREELIINSDEELISQTFRLFGILYETADKEKLNFLHVIDKMCIGINEKTNTMQFMDYRTDFLMKEFMFYENTSIIPYNSQIWYDSVLIFKRNKPSLF